MSRHAYASRDSPPSHTKLDQKLDPRVYDEDVKEATLGPNRAQIDASIITYNL